MNEPITAKFSLQYNASIEEYIEDNFVDNNLFPDIIEFRIEEFRDNYSDEVVEELVQIFTDVVYDEERECHLHPLTGEPIEYDSWDDVWNYERGVVKDELVESFLELIEREIDREYFNKLNEEIRLVVNNYVEESLEYDFPR